MAVLDVPRSRAMLTRVTPRRLRRSLSVPACPRRSAAPRSVAGGVAAAWPMSRTTRTYSPITGARALVNPTHPW